MMDVQVDRRIYIKWPAFNNRRKKSSNVVAMLFRNGLSGRQINNFTFRGNLYSIQTKLTKHARMGEGEGDGVHGTEYEQ